MSDHTLYDYDYAEDDSQYLYEIFEVRTGKVVGHANQIEDVEKQIAKLSLERLRANA